MQIMGDMWYLSVKIPCFKFVVISLILEREKSRGPWKLHRRYSVVGTRPCWLELHSSRVVASPTPSATPVEFLRTPRDTHQLRLARARPRDPLVFLQPTGRAARVFGVVSLTRALGRRRVKHPSVDHSIPSRVSAQHNDSLACRCRALPPSSRRQGRRETPRARLRATEKGRGWWKLVQHVGGAGARCIGGRTMSSIGWRLRLCL